MNFKKNKYTVLKKAISPQLAKFVFQYFMLKRKVAKKLFDERYIFYQKKFLLLVFLIKNIEKQI